MLGMKSIAQLEDVIRRVNIVSRRKEKRMSVCVGLVTRSWRTSRVFFSLK